MNDYRLKLSGCGLCLTAILMGSIMTFESPAAAQEAILSPLDVLADQNGLMGKTAKVKGEASCNQSIVSCSIVEGSFVLPFNATSLPENDRRALLTYGVKGSKKIAVITLIVARPGYAGSDSSKATAIEFIP